LRSTSNALTLQMSGEQNRLQVPPKLFAVNRLHLTDNQAENSSLSGALTDTYNNRYILKWF